ncbi:HK97 gp10 family phage protein [Embleya sp. NPDC059237]|uniref:HK97 gp10 family phage protein n=1 Tax=Embleya sp. NPDC059237 TaxID=3346784 RepID=UPI0036BBF7EC
MPTRFKLDKRGVGELLRSQMMLREMISRAEAIKSTAEAIAPVSPRPDDHHAGLYKASFKVSVTDSGSRLHHRAQATVHNSAWYSAWIEYGAEGGRGGGHHVLLRATQAAGGG